MSARHRWSWILCGTGILVLLVGCVAPGGGTMMILPGSGLIAVGALLAQMREP